MAFTVTERQVWLGSLTSGTTMATASFAATGGGRLLVAAACGTDSSVVFADPTSVTGHGGTLQKLNVGQSFQSSDPSTNFSLWESTDYTAASAAVTATWGTTCNFRAIYGVEITATGAITRSYAKSFEGTSSTVLCNMDGGVGTLTLQFINSWYTTMTLLPLTHFAAGTELEDASSNSISNLEVAYFTGITASPTIGGLLSAAAMWWCAIGVVYYEGSAPVVGVRRRAVSGRVNGTSPLSMTHASFGQALQIGDLYVIGRTVKPTTATAEDVPAGTDTDFTLAVNTTGGTGTQGNDAGPQRVRVDYRTNIAGDDGDVTLTQTTTPNSVTAFGLWLENLLDTDGGWSIVSTSGTDDTHGTGRAITGAAALAFQPDDVLVCVVGSDTDATTAYTAATLTATGVTFGPTMEVLPAGGGSTGQDVGQMVYIARVDSGSATIAPALSLTAGPSTCGPAVFLRARPVGVSLTAVGRDLDLRYDVKATVGRSNDLRYDVLGSLTSVGRDYDLRYDIRAFVGRDNDLRYNVLTNIVAEGEVLYVDSTKGQNSATAGTTVTTDKPVMANGDVLYIIVCYTNTDPGLVTTGPFGTPSVNQIGTSSRTNETVTVWRKVITDAASEPSTYSVILSSAGPGKSLFAVTARGADQTTPERSLVFTNTAGSGTNQVLPHAAVVVGDLSLVGMGAVGSGTGPSYTFGTGPIEVEETNPINGASVLGYVEHATGALVADDFNRPDNTVIGAPWDERFGAWQVASNGVIQTDAGSGPGFLIYNLALGSPDLWIEARLALSNGSGNIGLMFRMHPTAGTGWSYEVADGNYALINAIDGEAAGSDTGAGHTHATGELYRVEAEGNALRFYLNGSQVMTQTYATYNTYERVGLHFHESASGVVRWDSFRAGVLPYVAPPDYGLTLSASDIGIQFHLVVKPAAAGGTTTVGRDYDLRFNDQAAVGRSNDLRFNDLALVTRSNDLRFNLRALAARDNDLRFNTLALVTRSNDLRFNLRAAIGRDNVLRFNIEAWVGRDYDLRYSLRALVGRNSDLRFNVLSLGAVGRDLDLRFNVLAAVARTNDLRFNLRAAVGKDNILRFNDLILVTRTNDLRFNLRAAVGQSFDLRYGVRALVTRSNDLRYNVVTFVGRSNDLRYALRAAVGTPYDLRYSVLSTIPTTLVGRDYDLRYALRAAIGRDNVLRFNSRSYTGRDHDLRYGLRSLVTRSNDLVFSERSLVGQNNLLRYSVRSLIGRNNDLRYTLRALVGRDNVLVFNERALVSQAYELRYDVRIQLFVVGRDHVLVYSIRQSVGSAHDLAFAIAALIGREYVLRYGVRPFVEIISDPPTSPTDWQGGARPAWTTVGAPFVIVDASEGTVSGDVASGSSGDPHPPAQPTRWSGAGSPAWPTSGSPLEPEDEGTV